MAKTRTKSSGIALPEISPQARKHAEQYAEALAGPMNKLLVQVTRKGMVPLLETICAYVEENETLRTRVESLEREVAELRHGGGR